MSVHVPASKVRNPNSGMQDQTVIQINHLQVKRNGTTICAVPQLAVDSGDRLGILGENGSGKSTLLRVLDGLETEYAGTCQVASGRRQRVFVDQRVYLFRGTVLSNVTFGPRARGIGRRRASLAAMDLLKKLDIAHLAEANANHLSAGEKRRTALARAIAIQPTLLLLDEPAADLDGQGIQCLRQVLDELTQTTILITSPTSLPEGFVTRVYRMPSLRDDTHAT